MDYLDIKNKNRLTSECTWQLKLVDVSIKNLIAA